MSITISSAQKIKEISVNDLKKLFDENANLQLIDVREPWEYKLANIGGELIPMNDVEENIHRIDKDKMVVVMCRSGKRSASVIHSLQKNFGFKNVYNLEGGVLAWSDKIDRSIKKY